MNMKSVLCQKSELLFPFCYAAYISTTLMERTMFMPLLPDITPTVFKLIRYCVYLLCLAKFLASAISERRKLFFGLTVLGITAITACVSDNRLITMSFIFLAAVNCDKSRIIRTYLAVTGIHLIITILCAYTGVIDNLIFDPQGRARLGLGYSWTTTAPITYMFLVFCIVYIRGNELRWYTYLILAAGAFFLFSQTNTRFAFMLTVAYLLYCFFEFHIAKGQWYFQKKIGKLNILWPIIFAIVAIAMQMLYSPENEFWEKLNGVLSNRLWYGYNAINNYDLTLFGQNIEWIGHSFEQELNGLEVSDDFIDNAYLRYLYLYGFAGLSLILSIYCLGLYKAVKFSDWPLVTVYFFVLAFCVTELWIDHIDVNPFALLAVSAFTPVNHKHNTKKTVTSGEHSTI